MRHVGRIRRMAYADNKVVGLESLIVSPAEYGLQNESQEYHARLFDIYECMDQRIERDLGLAAVQGYGWCVSRAIVTRECWMTPEEVEIANRVKGQA